MKLVPSTLVKNAAIEKIVRFPGPTSRVVSVPRTIPKIRSWYYLALKTPKRTALWEWAVDAAVAFCGLATIVIALVRAWR